VIDRQVVDMIQVMLKVEFQNGKMSRHFSLEANMTLSELLLK
jgi:hypothetical protein